MMEEFWKVMETLDKRKTNRHDELSIWLLQECAKEVSTALHILFTDSLNHR